MKIVDAKLCDITKQFYVAPEQQGPEYVLCRRNEEGDFVPLDVIPRLYNRILRAIDCEKKRSRALSKEAKNPSKRKPHAWKRLEAPKQKAGAPAKKVADGRRRHNPKLAYMAKNTRRIMDEKGVSHGEARRIAAQEYDAKLAGPGAGFDGDQVPPDAFMCSMCGNNPVAGENQMCADCDAKFEQRARK